MLLSELKTNDKVTYRIGTHGASKINWGEWKEGIIYVARRSEDLPVANRKFSRAPRAGQIVTLGIELLEFSEGDYDLVTNIWSSENCLLQIKDLGKAETAQPSQPEYEEKLATVDVDLADVIAHYAKGVKVNGGKVLSYEWAINPLTNKVMFALTVQKNKS